MTPAINSAQRIHNAQLGERWLSIRLHDADDETRERALSVAREARGAATEHRAASCELATRLVREAAERLPAITLAPNLADCVDHAAMSVIHLRGAVDRYGTGRREIRGIPSVEEPYRLAGQLTQVACGVLALGLDADAAARVVWRCALDSAPPERIALVRELANGEALTAAALARRSAVPRTTTTEALEELEALGLVAAIRDPEAESSDQRKPVSWRLLQPYAAGLTEAAFAPTTVEVR